VKALIALLELATYPQLYVNGELLGGCDIALEMYRNGELRRCCPRRAPSRLIAQRRLVGRRLCRRSGISPSP